MIIVYYSSATQNTRRFVDKLDMDCVAIPISGEPPIVSEPYVLITPTYGGGASMMGRPSHPVPHQVKKFLTKGDNAEHMVAVIAGGNINFGSDYGKAGDIISQKFGVPYVYRFELAGTDHDVSVVTNGIAERFPDF